MHISDIALGGMRDLLNSDLIHTCILHVESGQASGSDGGWLPDISSTINTYCAVEEATDSHTGQSKDSALNNDASHIIHLTYGTMVKERSEIQVTSGPMIGTYKVINVTSPTGGLICKVQVRKTS